MSVLRVQCETCQATLKVRDEGFVGEVHACPRCGSMVLIAGAAPAAAETAPTTLAISATLEAVEPVVDTTRDIEAPAEPSPAEGLDRLEDAPPDGRPPEPEFETAAPASSWAPLATTLASLAATGSILAVWWLQPAASPVEPAEPPTPVAGVEAEQPVEPTPVVARSEPDTVETDRDPTFTPEPADLVTSLPPELPEAPPTATVATAPEPAPQQPVEPTVEPTETSAIDPLAFDPAEAVLVLRRGATPDATESDPIAVPVETFEVEPEEPTLDERLAAAAGQAGIYVALGPTGPNTAPPVTSAEVALARTLPAIDLRDAPLDSVVRLISRLAGVPITLTPDALRRAGVMANKPIDVAAENASLSEVLTKALAPARLEPRIEGAQVLVVRRGATAQRTIDHRVDDLEDGRLLDYLSEVAGLPLDEVSPSGELSLTAPMATHYDLLVACERLRVERGLPSQTKYPRRLLGRDAADRLASTLDRRTTFSFVEPTPLADVFDHWRRVTETPILVDWRSLAGVGLGPPSEVECSVLNRTWRDALDGVLGPLGLTCRGEFGGAIWISVP